MLVPAVAATIVAVIERVGVPEGTVEPKEDEAGGMLGANWDPPPIAVTVAVSNPPVRSRLASWAGRATPKSVADLWAVRRNGS